MKQTKRILSLVFCLLIILMSFSACTIHINVIDNEGILDQLFATANQPANNQAATQPATQPAATQPAATQPAATQPAASGNDATQPAETQPAASGNTSDPSTPAEVLELYKEVYKTTKATGTFKGTAHMTATATRIEGKDNGMLLPLANQFLGGDTPDQILCPDREDNQYMECDATVEDIESATYTDNGDGTATIQIVPKKTVDGKKFTSPTGKFFCVLEDVADTVSGIPIISWSEGDANSNTHLTTDGNLSITFDKSTKMATQATYFLHTVADVQHISVLMFTDKSAQAEFEYVVNFPE